jgi:glycosyltransferase involved in cell wall biosynthesis
MRVCLVAIAKNEGRFLAEWIAHYLSLGFDQIFLFDHESTDGTADLIERGCRGLPVTRIAWASRPHESPQLTAYNYALKKLTQGFDWVCFFDCDEFLVLKADPDIHTFLQRYDESVGAIGISWLTFGSSGRRDNDYVLVTQAFRRGAARSWGNNKHFKTIARPSAIVSMGIHDCVLKEGLYIHPDGGPLTMPKRRGRAARIDHSLAQLNHYQVKSWTDFKEKMQRGRAGKAMNDPTRFRAGPEDFFQKADRNRRRYNDIDANKEERLRIYWQIIEASKAAAPKAPSKWSIPILRSLRAAIKS